MPPPRSRSNHQPRARACEAPRRKVPSCVSLDIAQRREVSVLDHLLDRRALGHETKLVRDSARRAGLARRSDHLFGFLDVEGERLFAHDVLAGVERGENVIAMRERRRGDDDRIELASVEHRFAHW